jgi:hypothetical protein
MTYPVVPSLVVPIFQVILASLGVVAVVGVVVRVTGALGKYMRAKAPAITAITTTIAIASAMDFEIALCRLVEFTLMRCSKGFLNFLI